jgi:hypothetical protein
MSAGVRREAENGDGGSCKQHVKFRRVYSYRTSQLFVA